MAGNIPGEMEAIWSSFLLLSIPYRPWLWLSALVLACGALSICWRAMDRITLDRMLMCHKETHKRLIDSSPNLFRKFVSWTFFFNADML